MNALFFSAVLVVSLATSISASGAPPVLSASIAAGKELWFDSDPRGGPINARVDIGSMKQVGDEIEVSMAWPMSPGLMQILKRDHPKLVLPPGSEVVDVERIHCRPEGALSFGVKNQVRTKEGKVIHTKEKDVVEARNKAMEVTATWPLSYGSDPRSLVCWAAARKCEKKDFVWPQRMPEIPLEKSERADKMRAEWYALFVPKCRLGS